MRENIKKLIINTILITFISPLIILCIWSFASSWVYPNLLPNEVSIRGLEYIFNNQNLNILINSLLISIIVVFITVLISIPASKAIAIYEFKGKKLFELLILSPIIVPMISVAMGIHVMFIKLGLANTIIGVVIINILPCIPYAIRIISDVYIIIGDKYEVQGKMLGASKFNVFRFITLPLILPGIIGAASMSFIVAFSQYFLTMLIGGGRVITYPMVMFPYIQSGDRTIASLYSMVFLIVSILVLILLESKIKKHYKQSKESKYL